jgi:hypothetical protein
MKKHLLAILLFCSCHNPANKASNDTLDSLRTAPGPFADYYRKIQSKSGRNTSLAAKAQNLYTTIQQADSLLTTIKQTLLQKDPGGGDTGTAKQLLVRTPQGDDLKAASLGVSDFCFAALIDQGKRKTLDSALNRTAYIKYHPDWQEQYFNGSPTVAALTILSALQSDFKKAGAIVLKDIDEHLQ